MYAQSVFKHLLTQGDALLIALFTTLSSQGVYALASNYGSLLARMLFQPIEESSRSLFGRLLSADKSAESSRSAYTYLTNALRLYALLSAVIVFLGPALAPLLLTRIAGPAWSNTSAPKVLSVYCYYIPLLAINGILEAFVSAVSTPSQLQVQSAWMLGFSAGFAATGYLLLSVYDLGAKGLVAANAVNMAMRIVWSWSFVRQFFREKGISLSIRQPLPRLLTIASGTLVAILLDGWRRNSRGTFMELLQVLVISGVYGVLL